MSELSVSILFRAINAVTAPARAVTQAVTGITSATKVATQASTQFTKATNTAATAHTRLASALAAETAAAEKLAKVPPPPFYNRGRSGIPLSPREELDRALMTGMTGTIVGNHLAGIGGALTRPITSAVKVAAQYEATMSGVSAVTNATTIEFAALDAKARELGRKTFFTATQVAEGMHFLGMAGFRTNQIISAMPPTLDMARAGAIDLGQAADIASNILTGFGLEADKMGRVADVLTYTFTTSNTNLSMLGDSMKYVAPIARGLRIEIEETAAMIGLLGNAGIQGSQAGTTLRAGLLRLAAPRNVSNRMLSSVGLSPDEFSRGANEAASALAALGVESKDAEGNLRPIATILRDIHEATQDYGQAERAAIISRIFGMEAASGFMELVNQAGQGGLDKYIQAVMENSENSASRVAKKMGDNFAGAVIQMRSAWEGLQIATGTPIGNAFTPFINLITTGIRVVTKLASVCPPLTGALGVVIFAIGLLILTLGGAFAAGAALIGGLAALKFAFIYLGIPIQTVSLRLLWLKIQALFTAGGLRALSLAAITCGRNLIILSLRGIVACTQGLTVFAITAIPIAIKALMAMASAAIPALIAAIQWLNVTIYSIPVVGWILAIIAALILVGTLINKHWEPIKNFFSDFFGSVKQGTKGMLNSIGSSLKPLAEWLQLDHFWEGFTDLITAAGKTFDQWIIKPFKYLTSGITALAAFFGIGSRAAATPIDIAPPAITAPAVPSSADTDSVFYSPTTGNASSRNHPTIINAPGPVTHAGDTITITINAGPGQDPKAIADEVARLLAARQRHTSRNQLTDYDDNA